MPIASRDTCQDGPVDWGPWPVCYNDLSCPRTRARVVAPKKSVALRECGNISFRSNVCATY